MNRIQNRSDLRRCNELLRTNRLLHARNRKLQIEVCGLIERTRVQSSRITQTDKVTIIISAATQCFDVTVEEIRSKKRPERIAFPRQAAMAFAVKYGKITQTEVGEIFKRDHSTVGAAIKRVQAREETDADIRAKLAAMRELVERI